MLGNAIPATWGGLRTDTVHSVHLRTSRGLVFFPQSQGVILDELAVVNVLCAGVGMGHALWPTFRTKER